MNRINPDSEEPKPKTILDYKTEPGPDGVPITIATSEACDTSAVLHDVKVFARSCAANTLAEILGEPVKDEEMNLFVTQLTNDEWDFIFLAHGIAFLFGKIGQGSHGDASGIMVSFASQGDKEAVAELRTRHADYKANTAVDVSILKTKDGEMDRIVITTNADSPASTVTMHRAVRDAIQEGVLKLLSEILGTTISLEESKTIITTSELGALHMAYFAYGVPMAVSTIKPATDEQLATISVIGITSDITHHAIRERHAAK